MKCRERQARREKDGRLLRNIESIENSSGFLEDKSERRFFRKINL